MRVENSKPVSTNKKSDKKQKAAAGFGDALAQASESSESASSGSTSALNGISSLDGVLSLQEVNDEGGGNKQAYESATLTLDALDELRVALLTGMLPANLLPRIERLMQSQKALIIDPQMRAIIDEVELRAAVELAKLEMSMK